MGNTHNARIDSILLPVTDTKIFRHTLALRIAGANACRVHNTVLVFLYKIETSFPVNLSGRQNQELFRPVFSSVLKKSVGSEHISHRRSYRVGYELVRSCLTCGVNHNINLSVKRKRFCHILIKQMKICSFKHFSPLFLCLFFVAGKSVKCDTHILRII